MTENQIKARTLSVIACCVSTAGFAFAVHQRTHMIAQLVCAIFWALTLSVPAVTWIATRER